MKLQQLHIKASYPSEFVLKTLRRCKQHSQVFLASVFQMLQLFKLFMPSLQRFFETPMFDVDARALKTLNRRSRHTSFESLYNLDSKKKKRLHIIFRSLWSGARFVPSVDLGKQWSDSSKIWFFVCNLDFWRFFVKVNEWQNLSCRTKGSRDNMKAFLLFRI